MTSVVENSVKPVTKRIDSRSGAPKESLAIDNLLWRLNARLEQSATGGSAIGVIGACRDAGVSTLVANLATRAANSHMAPVLILDANFAAPKQHRLFRLKPKFGTSEVLSGDIAPVEAVLPTSVDGLDLIPIGPVNKLELTRVFSENCMELLRWARENYSTIVVDLPPIDDIRQGLILARQLDMALIAIKADAVRRSVAEQNVERLISDGVKVVGTILTRKRYFAPKMFRG